MYIFSVYVPLNVYEHIYYNYNTPYNAIQRNIYTILLYHYTTIPLYPYLYPLDLSHLDKTLKGATYVSGGCYPVYLSGPNDSKRCKQMV